MEFLTPEIALGSNKTNYKFQLICQKFKTNLNDLTQDWLTMEYNFSDSQKVVVVVVCKLKNFNDKPMFPIF